MRSSRLVVLSFTLIALALTSCEHAPPAPDNSTPLPPHHMLNGPYLNIRTPNSEGWHQVTSNTSDVTFAKDGATKGESFIATVPRFPLIDTANSVELMSAVRKIVEADNASPRVTPVETKYETSTERSYPCIRVTNVVADNEAGMGLDKTEKLLMQTKALYCGHPTLGKTGFGALFSHRGYELYPNFDVEADDFINGVQVPGH